jgi:hypothetical protein
MLIRAHLSRADERHYDYSRDRTWLHANINWLRFGPAVIRDYKRVDLHLNEINSFKVLSTDKNFSSILEWIVDNFDYKLNMSPNDIVFKAVIQRNYLVLYASEKARMQDELVVIPLSPKMLSSDEQSFEKQIEGLKQKMAAYRFQLPKEDQNVVRIVIVLSPDDDWVDTKMAVSPYNLGSLSVKSEDVDRWIIANNPACGVQGVMGKEAGPEYILPMAPPGSLLGKIGNGKPFIIRNGQVILPREVGELYIRANTSENASCRRRLETA